MSGIPFTDLEVARLFATIIPTLPQGDRFAYTEGVLIDFGPDITDMACPVTVFTTTLSERGIGSAMASLYAQLHSPETADRLGVSDISPTSN